MKLSKFVLLFFGLLAILSPVNPGYYSPGNINAEEMKEPPFLSADSAMVDSLMNTMSLDQKIAQMLMVQAYSNRDASHLEDLKKLVKRYNIGGLIFFQGGPVRQANMINSLQKESKIPLLIAMDAEWGLGMRLDSVINYPREMTLGAISDNQLIYALGQDFARQLKELGVHMNFSPVADINNNPDNPVINTRSFGEDRENVSEKVNALFKGMQSERILVTAKHFPGHGDTNTDSHHALPLLNFDRARLDSIELYPFKKAITQGLSGIMVAHLQVPALDGRENRPTTLSHNVVSDLLKDELGFKGLVVTDAMNMKGVSENFKPGELEIEAVKAGNDILLMPTDVSKVISQIKRAIRKGDIQEDQINNSCRKILMAKVWLDLDNAKTVKTKGLVERLNSRSYLLLQHELAEQSITLLKDDHHIIPLGNMETLQLATLNIGIGAASTFTKSIDLYHSGDHYFYEKPEVFPNDSTMHAQFSKYNTLIVSLYYTRSYGNNFDIPEGVSGFINSIDFEGDLLVNIFNYPYALGVLGSLENSDAIIVSYTNDELNQLYAAEGIFGGTSFTGRLPVSVGERYPLETGIQTEGGVRLKYSCPESVSMDYDTLKFIESIIQNAIKNKAMPGCQLLIARKGEVVWNKSYGYHTYRKRQPVQNMDLYDLASITKIASTIPSLMRLQDQGKFSVDSSLGVYISELDTSAKRDLQIRDILTHQSGLKAWIPFYYKTLVPMDTSQSLISNNWSHTYPLKIGPSAFANRNIEYQDSIIETSYSAEYPIHVATNMYLRADYRDTIYNSILASPLGEKVYKYSDLGYYYFFKVVERLTDTLFYPYNWFNFYGPLGAETMGFLPLNRFDARRIVPTENDLLFRRQLLRGNVHDPGAAMLGGVCGHAGLFSNANDLAKLMQMYLNNGVYGNKRFIDSSTISEFTRCQFPENENRRGLGFDRPITEEDDAGPVCNEASDLSYGHSGFTGTIVWADPKYDLIYIFLSNRINPDQFNTKLVSMNVRTDIQSLIYRSMEDYSVGSGQYPVGSESLLKLGRIK